jgi:transcription elongation factor GreA
VTHTSTEKAIWLTQEAYDRLTAELVHLKGPGRAEISRRIADAREEGDLRENGGYHAAREEQSKAESRILQLEAMLASARVGETETFLLGAREVLARHTDDDLRVYSPQSPLGSAILGKRPGESATFTAPNGKQTSVEIVAAKPFSG